MMKVLIMDDEPNICQVLRHIIDWTALGFVVAGEAHDGIEGLRKAEQLRPDIVIMDIRMPGADGLSLIGQIKQMNPYTAFIIVSGYREFEYAKSALAQGVQEYLLKPVNKQELEAAVEKARESILQRERGQQEVMGLRCQLDSSLQELTERFFQRLLVGAPEKPIDLEQINAKYGCKFVSGGYKVICYKLDGFGAAGRLEELMGRVRAGMEHGPMAAASQIFPLSQTMMVQIWNWAGIRDSGPVYNAILADFRRYARGQCQLTISVGHRVDSIHELWKSAECARRGLQSRISLGAGGVIDTAKCRLALPPYAGILTDKERIQLSILLNSADQEGALACMRSIIRRVRQERRWDNGMYGAAAAAIELLQLPRGRYSELLTQLDECSTEEQLAEVYRQALDSLPDMAGNGNRMIQIVKEYVNSHYMQDIRIRDVAELISVTPKYFSDLFKKETGETFTDYLTNYRMETAKDLLKNSCKRVNEISMLTGYQDAKYFSKQFRKSTGVSPAKFRKIAIKHLKEQPNP